MAPSINLIPPLRSLEGLKSALVLAQSTLLPTSSLPVAGTFALFIFSTFASESVHYHSHSPFSYFSLPRRLFSPCPLFLLPFPFHTYQPLLLALSLPRTPTQPPNLLLLLLQLLLLLLLLCYYCHYHTTTTTTTYYYYYFYYFYYFYFYFYFYYYCYYYYYYHYYHYSLLDASLFIPHFPLTTKPKRALPPLDPSVVG